MAFGLALGFRRRVARVPAINPATLFSGASGAWYDPSDLTTVWQDSGRTTPAVVGDPVGCIDDKSGAGLHMTQATAAARPTLRQDAGGFYYLERDGSDDYMHSAASVALALGFTIAYGGQHAVGSGSSNVAFATVALNSTNYLAVGFRQDVADGRAMARADSTGGALVAAQGTNGVLGGINAAVIATLRTTTATVSVNADADSSIALSGTYGPVAACRVRLGLQTGVATNVATRCYGLIVVNRELTDLEKVGVSAYLTSKMGV